MKSAVCYNYLKEYVIRINGGIRMGIFSKKTLLESDIKYLKKAFIYQFIYDFLEKPYSVNEEALKIDRLTLVFDDIICWKKAEEYYIELRNCGTYSQDDAYLIISDKNKETVDIHSLMKGISKHNMHELEEAYNEHLKQLATSLYFHPATTGFYFKRKNVYSGHDMNEYLKNGGYIISDIVEASKNEDTLQIFSF